MEPSAVLPNAFAAIALGLGLLTVVWFSLRLARRSRAWNTVRVPSPVTLPVSSAPTSAAVLLADHDGQLRYINTRARELFGVGGATPTIWQLMRKVAPAPAFEALFGMEGQTSLNIGAQHWEATSLRLTEENEAPRFAIVLREAGQGQPPDLDLVDASSRTGSALQLIIELTAALAGGPDLETVMETSLSHLGRAFQYNSAVISLWDEAEGVLRPACHAGSRDYERELAKLGRTAYRPDEGLAGWVVSQRAPLRASDLRDLTVARPLFESADFPVRAYLGVPLLAGAQLIGTVELMSLKVNAYRQGDELVLAAVASLAAVAIQNAQHLEAQRPQLAELQAFTAIAQAIEETADPRVWFTHLTEGLARLTDAQIVGILQFDPVQNLLVSQPPFYGLPDIVSVLYQIMIPSGSAVERLWQANQPWFSNAVETDADIDATGLRQVADAVGFRTSLLVPVSVGGRKVGALHLCNKAQGQLPFTDKDAALLLSFAGQVAAILDNARLMGDARSRTAQAEGLRGVATALASSTNQDEILRTAMQQSAALFHFDVGVISLLDEARGELAPHLTSLYGLMPEKAQGVRMVATEPDYAVSVTRQRRLLLVGSVQRDQMSATGQPLSTVYRTALEQFKLESAMAVPLIVGDHCLGEWLVGARREEAFARADLELLATLAAQLASGLERARLYASTDQNLQRRVEQLTALTRVSREINQSLALDHLLRLVVDEVQHVTRADCGTLVLLAGPDQVERRVGDEALGLQLTALEAEMAAEAAAAAEPGLLGPRRVANLPPASPLAAHPDLGSALLVPIWAGGVLAGLIHMHSRQAEGFDEAAEEMASTLAAQTAIAVTNAQRAEEQQQRTQQLSRRADQLAQLLQISRSVRSDLPLAANLEIIAAGIWESVGFNTILVSVRNPQTRQLNHLASAGMPLERFEQLRNEKVPWAEVTRYFIAEFGLSQSYFVPQATTEASGRGNAWQPQDRFLVPIVGSQHEPVGLLWLDSPVDGRRPDKSTAELAEIFANQAALVIENAHLYQAAERRAAQLLALHRVIEHASRVADRSRLWQAMAESLVGELGLDVCLIAMVDFGAQAADPDRLRFVVQGQAGQMSGDADFAPMFANMVSLAALERGEAERLPEAARLAQAPVVILEVANSTTWANHPLILATQVKSFASTPILSQGQLAGLLFAGSRASPSPLTPEDLDVFVTLANQAGASLESARLEAQALAERSQRTAQLAALSDVSRIITAALRVDDVMATVTQNLQRVIPYDSVTLWLRAERQKLPQLYVAAAQGFENDAERIGLTVDLADSVLFAEMARTGGAILVPDVRLDARFPGAEYLPARTWLGAPLISKGQILGALVLDRVEVNAYNPQIAQVLMAFSNQAAIALDNARLFEESERRTVELDERSQRLALLNRVSIQLSSTLNENRLYKVALTEVALALNVPQAAVIAFDDDGKTWVAAQLPGYTPLPPGFDHTPAIQRVYQTLKPVAVEDVAQDSLLVQSRAIFAERDVKSLLVIPLAVAGTPVAAMQLEETTAVRRFTPGEVELAQTLANQAAVAVQNARLYNEAQTRLNELAILNRVSHALAMAFNLDDVYQTVRDQVMGVMGVDSIYLALYDEPQDLVAFPFMVEKGEFVTVAPDQPGGLTGHILRTRQPLLLRGGVPAIQAQLQKLEALQVGTRFAHSYLGVPLIIGERIIGVLAVQDLERTDLFTATQERLLTIIAAQVAVTVENARFAQELEARVAARTLDLDRARLRMETLLNITTELSSSLDLELVLARTLEMVTASVKAPRGAIYLIDDANPSQLIYRAALGRPVPLRPGGEPSLFNRNEGLIGWVIRNRQGVISGNLEEDPRWTRLPDRPTQARSALAVPLMVGEEVLGGMVLLSLQLEAFDEEQLRLVAAAANQVGAAINNAKLYRMIEDLNRETGQALREQMVESSKSRAILEGIADGVIVIDDRGTVTLFNAACERILGLQRSQVVGQPATNFVGIYGASGRPWLEAITKWSRDPDSYRVGEFFSEQVALENKRIISVHLAPVAMGREYLGSVSVVRDITREVEVDRLKSEFVTNVSHELRTPMAAIKGYADILLMGAGGPVAAQQAKFLQVIKGNADRLGMLVNDLLDISRIESGRVELVKQLLDIREVIKAVVDTIQGRAVQQVKPVTVMTEIPEGLPPVPGDRDRVMQLILAVAENAFNYSEPDQTIRIEVKLVADNLQIEVKDRGIGMTPEEQKRLFDRFYRGENPLVLKTPGNGLGLAIARQLAELHGGEVWLVASQVGQGSSFAITLPLA